MTTLDTLKALLEAATPVPWDSVNPDDPSWVDVQYPGNNELICELVNAAPALLSLLDAAEDMRVAALMAREELVFGGDWEIAQTKLTAALAKYDAAKKELG